MNFAFATILVSAISSIDASAGVISLTPDNYDAVTDGKIVFLKFFAPKVRVTLYIIL